MYFLIPFFSFTLNNNEEQTINNSRERQNLEVITCSCEYKTKALEKLSLRNIFIFLQKYGISKIKDNKNIHLILHMSKYFGFFLSTSSGNVNETKDEPKDFFLKVSQNPLI